MSEGKQAPWEEGEVYEGQIIDHRIEELNNEKRTPYILIVIDSDGDYAYAKEWLTDKALQYSIAHLRRAGFTGDDIVLLNLPEGDDAIDADNPRDFELRGQVVKFKMEASEDGQYWNVKSYWSPSSGKGKKKSTVSSDTLAALSAKSKAIASSVQDEIPF